MFRYLFLRYFNYTIKNDMEHRNIYNLDKIIFVISCNKRRHAMVRKGRKTPRLIQYNSRELITVIEAI